MLLPTLLLIADIVSKRLAVWSLRLAAPAVLIPDWLRLIYVENTGAAFGIFPGSRVLLVLISLSATVGLLYLLWTKKYQNLIQKRGLQFVLAGAAGNLIDRVLLGYVVDFIDLPYWPTFNFADIFINVGVFLLLLDIILDRRQEASS